MHGLFDDDMGVYRDWGKPEYTWQHIDELYDFLECIGMKPFLELSFMPDALASGSQTVFWHHGNVTPPRICRNQAGACGRTPTHPDKTTQFIYRNMWC
jgi:xylan 1,4-beta-xylosidase